MLVEKLNKGKYVLEDEEAIIDGKWEGYLDHDNVDYNSISVYTGSKFTGDKVDNYFISTPFETPWKAYLKVFSNSEKIYITYESTGDQVEAEDINVLQDEIIKKVDKVSGKGLSDENYTVAEKGKLTGIEEEANNYTHPNTHPASMITGLPTTLPANGGNADKLDNQNSAYYTNIKARLGYTPANIAGDTFKGNVKMQQLSGDLVAALVTEVNGQLIDFGTNFTQSGSKDTTKDGGLFRIDARDGFPLFNVLYQPAGGAEQVLFSVDKDGTIYQGNKAHKIWHEGNDGSSSGLDADKVDGKDASAFANVSHTHDDRYFMYKNLTKSDGTMAAIGSADLNTITDTGFYFKNTTDNLNQPISNWGTLLVYKYDTTRIVQIFIPDNVSTMHVRPYNGAWMEWREMNGGGVVGPVTWNDLKGV